MMDAIRSAALPRPPHSVSLPASRLAELALQSVRIRLRMRMGERTLELCSAEILASLLPLGEKDRMRGDLQTVEAIIWLWR